MSRFRGLPFIWSILIIGVLGAALISGCSATTPQIIPTERPTSTPIPSVTPSATPDTNSTPTLTPSPLVVSATGGPSPTPLFGATRTPAGDEPTATRILNPNAARIEFFTADSSVVAPGSSVTLFWSTRNATSAVIYQLNRGGERERLWNVGPDGNVTISTGRHDRGQVDFLLVVGEGALQAQQTLSVPLACPIQWFFSPSPEECPNEEAEETLLIEQSFERGRMVYMQDSDLIYVLLNDGYEPAWIAFENRYNPEIHPELEESFVPAPGFYQPIAKLGFVWRGNDTVRNRLGLGSEPELQYNGFIQRATLRDGAESLYISSTNATVLQLLSGGDVWQIITLP